jgi:hypothetical protein
VNAGLSPSPKCRRRAHFVIGASREARKPGSTNLRLRQIP